MEHLDLVWSFRDRRVCCVELSALMTCSHGRTNPSGKNRKAGFESRLRWIESNTAPTDTVYNDRDIIQAYEMSLPITIAQWQKISLAGSRCWLQINWPALFNSGFCPPLSKRNSSYSILFQVHDKLHNIYPSIYLFPLIPCRRRPSLCQLTLGVMRDAQWRGDSSSQG